MAACDRPFGCIPRWLMIGMAVALLTTAEAGAAIQCYHCHGNAATGDYRPRDATFRNISTGGFVGNHQTHLAPVTSAVACARCHPGCLDYSPSHRDGSIKISSRMNNSPLVTTYRNTTSAFPQRALPVLGSCAGVNCHFETATPTWGSTAFVAPSDCNRCHGLAPATGSHPTSGGKHAIYYGTDQNSCRRCHPDHTSEAAPFAHATSAGVRNLAVGFAAAPNNGSGSYYGPLNDYLPSQGNSFGSCSDLYCHSPGNKASALDPPNRTATWGGSLGADCAGCHKSNAASGTVMASGSHNRHVYATNNIDCVKCHAATVNGGMTVKSYALHVNRGVNVAFNNTTTATNGRYAGAAAPVEKAPGSAYGSCQNVYCHSTGQPDGGVGAPTYRTPTWGNAASGACGSCHAVNASHNFSGAEIATGSHAKHLAYPLGTTSAAVRCTVCHNWTGAAFNPSCTSQCHSGAAAKHANQKVDLIIPAYFGASAAYSGTPKPGDGYGQCTNLYCHSAGTTVATGGVPASTAVAWGAGPLACNACHGNGTYAADFRRGTPLYASGAPKGNAHARHTKVGTLSGTYMQCYHCHATTTTTATTIADTAKHVNLGYDVASVRLGLFSSSYRDGDNTMNSTKVTVAYTFNAAGSSCANVSCHPVGVGQTRSSSRVGWTANYRCVDCHNIDMEETDTFHHAMRNYSTGYPTAAPSGDYDSAAAGSNATGRRCTMCHVDHDIFSGDLNAGNGLGRGANLRTAIGTVPTAGSGYTNTDFLKSGGGICISCHTNARTKDSKRRRTEPNGTTTPQITLANYSGSGHQYNVSARFMSDGSVVYGNCSKCHNALSGETSVFLNATSTYQFGNHNSGIRRLQGSLDAAGGETAEEQICYRCHSTISDSDPGGGPAKTVADRDFYGVAPMSAASQGIFAVNRDFRPAAATSTTNRLFFKPAAAEVPGAPQPDTPANDSDFGDAFTGGSYVIRAMSPWATTAAYETKSQDTARDDLSYWKMAKFVSPALAAPATVPAGSWVINLYSRESHNYQNARIRYKVYTWTAADGYGTTLIDRTTYPTELATTSAPGAIRQIAVTLGTVTLAAGQKLVVDLTLQTTSYGSTARTASYYFGNGAPSNLTLPGAATFSYADPGQVGTGHNVSHYAGIHRPSTSDETLTYLSANKHVECVDCHNPHAAKGGLHTQGNNALANVLRGVSGVSVSWSTSNWGTNSTATLVSITTAEYQVCFKCHSKANSNVTTWGGSGAAAWTDLMLEFNPNNKARHPVGQPLSAGLVLDLGGEWTAGYGQTMTCSDCHASDSATTKGPHGSAVKWMLKGPNQNWPYSDAANNGTSSGTLYYLGGTMTGLFCLNCHPTLNSTLSTDTNAVHIRAKHRGSVAVGACVYCHIRVPHGGKVSRLITDGDSANLPARYKPDGNGGAFSGLNAFNKADSPGSYVKTNCGATCGTHSTSVPGENW